MVKIKRNGSIVSNQEISKKYTDDKPKELKSVVRLRKKGTPQQSKCVTHPRTKK